MNTREAIRARRSHRAFTGRQISESILREIVRAGIWAPTARGEEPWEMIAVTSRELLKEIAGLAPNGSFIGWSAACIVLVSRPVKYYLEDGCAATENMLLAAADQGIASCWVAGDKKPYCSAVKRLLDVPSDFKLVSMIALGYPEGVVSEGSRKRGLNNVIHWQKY